MESREQLTLMIVIFTAIFFLVVLLVVILMVVNSNNRQKHRTTVAELELAHAQEVNTAEREATKQTMVQIGRELHDNVGQLLTVSKMGLGLVVHESESPDTRLTESFDALKESIKEVRRLGKSLNTDSWNRRTLQEAIQEEALRLERIGLCKMHLEISGQEQAFTNDVKIVLYRAFQEVVNNALKHSEATTIHVKLVQEPSVTLGISDNGKGFNEAMVQTGSGLNNIQRRCELIGFNAKYISAPGKGCSWTITKDSNERA